MSDDTEGDRGHPWPPAGLDHNLAPSGRRRWPTQRCDRHEPVRLLWPIRAQLDDSPPPLVRPGQGWLSRHDG